MEESHRRAGDLLIDLRFAAVVCLFVDYGSMQAKNPRFHVAAWNQVDDPFRFRGAVQTVLFQPRMELSDASVDIARIGVDKYNES